MRRLLSQTDGRILKLVELLYDKDELFMRDLCDELNVSFKTLKSDIENARLILSPIDIKISGNKGVKLEIPSNYSITYLYTALLSASVEYTLLEKKFLCETYTVDELAENLFISSSSLRRMVDRINEILQEEEMKINLNPVQIIGNEYRIYNFFVHYLLERYYFKKNIFTKAQIEAVKELNDFVQKINYVELEYRDRERLQLFFLVQLTRMKNNHFFRKEPSPNPNRQKNFGGVDTSFSEKKISDSFYKEFSSENLIQLFFIFTEGKWCLDYNKLLEHSKTNVNLKETKEKFEVLIESIASKYRIEQASREDLLVQLCNSRMLNYGTYYLLYDNLSAIVKHFKHDYFEGIEFIRLKLIEIFDGEVLKEYKLNEYICLLIIHWDKFLIELEKEVTPLKIGFVYDVKEQYGNLIQDEISYRFKNRFTIQVIDGDCLMDEEKVKNQCDLILTNMPSIVIPGIKVICFPIYPKEKDWSKLESFYYNFNFPK
ncbi:MerR family transcriptional regulator [Carnobacterium maltaromaticum]|uniref:helix-turn-helix domain-containing protein n=1 Tax=Carnobacterium maltaromaticum TaxID=2751 RepID=UPI000C76851D|nr:helix-turn-helix domain-containing protein [Carnobacterium maltaromaticum]PLS40842.1 MerR family transcriptional regulator [Carnobacterium maltaromaticum]PLS48258.1 MerR family transcriptional regulator [Carnobacterium maltaromaticum]